MVLQWTAASQRYFSYKEEFDFCGAQLAISAVSGFLVCIGLFFSSSTSPSTLLILHCVLASICPFVKYHKEKLAILIGKHWIYRIFWKESIYLHNGSTYPLALYLSIYLHGLKCLSVSFIILFKKVIYNLFRFIFRDFIFLYYIIFVNIINHFPKFCLSLSLT